MQRQLTTLNTHLVLEEPANLRTLELWKDSMDRRMSALEPVVSTMAYNVPAPVLSEKIVADALRSWVGLFSS